MPARKKDNQNPQGEMEQQDNYTQQAQQGQDLALELVKNSCELSGMVLSKNKRDGSQKIDKESGELKVKADGTPDMYPDSYEIELQYFGGTSTIPVTKEMYDSILPSRHYKLIGTCMPEIFSFGNKHFGVKFSAVVALS